MSIVAVYNVYNDVETFEDSIQSVRSIADKIVVADGVYSEFPGAHERPVSDDGTLDIAYRYADVVRSQRTPWAGESTKRNWLIDQVPDGDWVFRIDADEIVLRFDRQELETGAKVVMPRMDTYDGDDYLERQTHNHLLFRKTPDLHYKERDSLYYGDKAMSKVQRQKTTDDIVVQHFPDARPDERLERREGYREKTRRGGGI